MGDPTLLYTVCTIAYIGTALAKAVYSPSWECDGQSGGSQTSYRCTELGADGVNHGCFYNKQWEQYEPCDWYCDGVAAGSTSELECHDRCPGYLRRNCTLVTTELTTGEQQARTDQGVTTPNSIGRTKSTPAVFLIVIAASALVLVAAVLVAVGVLTGCLGCFRSASSDKEGKDPEDAIPIQAERDKAALLIDGNTTPQHPSDELWVKVPSDMANIKLNG